MSKKFCNLHYVVVPAIFCVFMNEVAYSSIQKTQVDGKAKLQQEQNQEQSAAARDFNNSNSPKAFRQVLSDLAWGRNRVNSGIMDQNKSFRELPNSFQKTPVQATLVPHDVALKQQQQARKMIESRMAYCGQNWQRDPSCGMPAPAKKTK